MHQSVRGLIARNGLLVSTHLYICGCTNTSDPQKKPGLMLITALALLLIVPQDSEDRTEAR